MSFGPYTAGQQEYSSEEQKHGAEDEGFTCFITLLLLVQLTPSHETAAFFQSLKPV